MPPNKPHDTTHTLLYAIISHLTPPPAENTKEWQMIADLLPERPWGGDVAERWRRVEKRVGVEKWLGEEEKEKDGMEEVEVRAREKRQGKGSEVGKEGNRVVGRRTVEVGKGYGALSLRKSKRKRPESGIDGEEIEEEEVVREVEMVVKRTVRMAVATRRSRTGEYGNEKHDSAMSRKDPMGLIQAKLKHGEKARKGKGLTGFLKRKLSVDLAAQRMSDSDSELEWDESDSPEEDQMDRLWTQAGCKIRRCSKGTKNGVRRMSKIPDSSSSEESEDSGEKQILLAGKGFKGTKTLKRRQSKIAEVDVSESEDEFWMTRVNLGRLALSLGD